MEDEKRVRKLKITNNLDSQYMKTQLGYNENDWYLGPWGWSKWILKMLPYGKFFNKAAFYHDVEYASPQTNQRRRMIDVQFYNNMEIILNSTHLNGISKVTARFWARVYFNLVFWFGSYFYSESYQNKVAKKRGGNRQVNFLFDLDAARFLRERSEDTLQSIKEEVEK